MKIIRNSRDNQKGQAVVEFALVSLLFFFLLFAIIDFGRIVSSYNVLAAATREASRYAMVHGAQSGSRATSADLQTQARNWSIGLDPSAVTVTSTWTPAGAPPGGVVLVQAQYPITPLVGLFGGTITLRSSSQIVISR
ncbi:MAG: TadE/TadG family type IV pilus assembly protein [Bryobacteraceae bacterium]